MSLGSIPYDAMETACAKAARSGVPKARDTRRRRPKQLLVLLGLLVSVGIGLGMLVIGLAGADASPRGGDVMLVLGNKVYPDGTPSERLRRRLDRAVELYQAGFAATVITSGGHANGVEEADAMKDYLVAHEVPAAAVVSDRTGVDTYSSARFAAKYLKEHGQHRVLVVSQFYHLPRAAYALKRFGVHDVSTAASRVFGWISDLRGLAREVPANIYYRLREYPA